MSNLTLLLANALHAQMLMPQIALVRPAPMFILHFANALLARVLTPKTAVASSAVDFKENEKPISKGRVGMYGKGGTRNGKRSTR